MEAELASTLLQQLAERTEQLRAETAARETKEAELASTQQQLAERTEQLGAETATRETKEAELASTQQQLAERTEQLGAETAARAAKEAELASMQQQLAERAGQLGLNALKSAPFSLNPSRLPPMCGVTCEDFGRKCGSCGRSAEVVALSRCASCKSAFYCDEACQKNAWQQHRSHCAEITRLRESTIKPEP
jgi:septal ring factor EnvC (AmiA/AmiB activator)